MHTKNLHPVKERKRSLTSLKHTHNNGQQITENNQKHFEKISRIFFFLKKVSWYGAPYFLSSVLYDLYQTVARRRTMSSTSDECGRVEAGGGTRVTV